jgi:hypothetical protein
MEDACTLNDAHHLDFEKEIEQLSAAPGFAAATMSFSPGIGLPISLEELS